MPKFATSGSRSTKFMVGGGLKSHSMVLPPRRGLARPNGVCAALVGPRGASFHLPPPPPIGKSHNLGTAKFEGRVVNEAACHVRRTRRNLGDIVPGPRLLPLRRPHLRCIRFSTRSSVAATSPHELRKPCVCSISVSIGTLFVLGSPRRPCGHPCRSRVGASWGLAGLCGGLARPHKATQSFARPRGASWGGASGRRSTGSMQLCTSRARDTRP